MSALIKTDWHSLGGYETHSRTDPPQRSRAEKADPATPAVLQVATNSVVQARTLVSVVTASVPSFKMN